MIHDPRDQAQWIYHMDQQRRPEKVFKENKLDKDSS
jgi:hypothetical protein